MSHPTDQMTEGQILFGLAGRPAGRERQRQAERMIAGASEDDLARRGPRLLRALFDAVTQVDDAELNDVDWTTNRRALIRLYFALELDPGFVAHEAGAARAFNQDITAWPDFASAHADWPKWDRGRREDFIARLVAAHSAAYGYAPPAGIEFFSKGKFRRDLWSPDVVTMGEMIHATGQLRLNTHADAGFDHLPTILNVALHENTHSHQRQLVRLLEEGRLAADDPRRAQAELFALNSRPAGRMCGSVNSYGYRRQPVEYHARREGMRLCALLTGHRLGLKELAMEFGIDAGAPEGGPRAQRLPDLGI